MLCTGESEDRHRIPYVLWLPGRIVCVEIVRLAQPPDQGRCLGELGGVDISESLQSTCGLLCSPADHREPASSGDDQTSERFSENGQKSPSVTQSDHAVCEWTASGAVQLGGTDAENAGLNNQLPDCRSNSCCKRPPQPFRLGIFCSSAFAKNS